MVIIRLKLDLDEDEIDEVYVNGGFIIRGDNVSVVMENGILDKVKVGDKITFTSAPRYFGDGYTVPIVALYIGDEEILNFDVGHKNLMKLY